MSWIFALVLIAVASIAAWFYLTGPRRRERTQIRALFVACKGDQDLVERLIFAEMQRDESLGYAGAARRALVRLQRDQR